MLQIGKFELGIVITIPYIRLKRPLQRSGDIGEGELLCGAGAGRIGGPDTIDQGLWPLQHISVPVTPGHLTLFVCSQPRRCW